MVNVTKALIAKLFSAASIQRWNDKMRPVDLSELDKQSHKMIIAYLLGKLEEKRGTVKWIDIIEGGIFELLQRTVLTDLKPQIYYRIKADAEKYQKLNEWAFKELEPVLVPLGEEFCQRYRSHFRASDDTFSKRILSAAHFYATKWEFKFIERANPDGYEIEDIKRDIVRDNETYCDLEGVKELILYRKLNSFIDLCGELRFQVRWSTTPRVPRTSVLEHMLLVAILSYLFSLQIEACESRRTNNFYTGLFHDLPEVLTRDIISPVKKSVRGLARLIKLYEKEEMERNVYALLKDEWRRDMELFTENEFANVVHINGKVVRKSSEEINSNYNGDQYNARDGELVKAVDELCAFVEAYTSTRHGISAPELDRARNTIRDRYAGKLIAGINFSGLLADFD
jgi:putative hydrolase of HD superfamily